MMMSSNFNEPSLRAQVFNLNTATVSIEQIPCHQMVKPSTPVSELTSVQVSRLTRIYHKVGYVIDEKLSDWLKDFTYDFHPEREIQIWEDIAAVFARYTKSYQLTLTQKREVVRRLIKLVGGEKQEDSVSVELLKLLQQEQADKFFIRPNKQLSLGENLDFRRFAQIYQEYVSRHGVSSDDNKDDLFVALTRLLEYKIPSTKLGIELLEIWEGLVQSESGYEQDFNPDDIKDERQKSAKATVVRPGQKRFKRLLIEAYGGCCSITGCSFEPVLEAAHIIPYLGPKTDHPANGLLLRMDIHKLFDAHYLSINPLTNQVEIAPCLKETYYSKLAEQALRLPRSKTARPNRKALEKHYQKFSELADPGKLIQ
ncbi:HNH endonuclease [Microcoleus sp. FACHB-SPT15]|uniref:HNH endonuclease n=1 Tax=Microcoleus sp. FACHB-SPT15 TaxID=2692830 RepID=UPI00177EE9AA|nr:HNH endonuclease signature motif containing protein [Microcoleus sp. FACHB-SPT15]MBD1808541.1 HNH endonuclease [Microcoleus sp. FACHB-SPT15]